MLSVNLNRVSAILARSATSVLMLFWASVVFATAQDLSAVAGTVQTNIASLAPLLKIVSYISGIAFCIAGIVQFKAHKDNPAQVPLSKPIVYLGVGAALLFLPSIMASAGSTLFGSDATSAAPDNSL